MLLIIFLISLAIGSFISVVTYRIPRNEGFIKGRSYCDFCRRELFWYDNIPLFSYLFYLGKSRCCKNKISIRYPLIELSTALGFVALFWLSLSPIYYILYTVSLAIFVIDLEHQIIPDELTWLLLLIGLIFNFSFLNLFSGLLMSLLFLILYLITSGRGMGMGDVKLAIPLGMFIGLNNSWTWLLVSFVSGGIVATILLLLNRAKLKTKIAFGPFMIFAFWFTLIYGKIF